MDKPPLATAGYTDGDSLPAIFQGEIVVSIWRAWTIGNLGIGFV